MIKRLTILALLFTWSISALAQKESRTILAVFAHPDDEIFVGPVLARYARSGAKVYLAIATKGEKGTSDPKMLGDPLAKLRHEEATCSCHQLGIAPPIFFDLNDGELGAITNPIGKNIQAVADNVQKLIGELHPQVIITWGPDGGYGHPDHRLVSNAVTQVVQSMPPGAKLVYAALSPEQTKILNTAWYAPLPWHDTDPGYLTLRVSFTDADRLAYHKALECHKSQYTSEEFSKLEKALDQAWSGTVSLRPWQGGKKSDDLFR